MTFFDLQIMEESLTMFNSFTKKKNTNNLEANSEDFSVANL